MAFEKFDEGARQAVLKAHSQADNDRAVQIEPIHLLVGIAESKYVGKTNKPWTLGAYVLRQMGLQGHIVRELANKVRTEQKPVHIGPGAVQEEASGTPISPATRKVLELAYREALSLGHTDVRSEHLLLGLLRHATNTSDDQVHRALIELTRHNVMVEMMHEGQRERGRKAS